MSEAASVTGRWRITEMDNWDQEAVDLVHPGFIEFDDDGLGDLGFIAVRGELDCRDANRDGRPGVEFSWQGSDEGDDVSGRGWAALGPDGRLEGHIYFHLGDDSAFRAERCDQAKHRMYRVPRPRAPEQLAAAVGPERWACYAVEDATGDFTGLTGIVANSAVPERLQVGQPGWDRRTMRDAETAAPLLQPGTRRT